MPASVNLAWWLIVGLVAAGILLIRHGQTGRTVGLTLAYIVSFFALYWLAPLMYLLPWFQSPYGAYGYRLTALGTQQASIAMVAFLVGAEIVSFNRQASHVRESRSRRQVTLKSAAQWCVIIGGVMYLVIAPVALRVASIGAVVSTGSTLLAVGVALKCWNAWREGDRRRLWLWMAASLGFPILTVVGQGFLGYGFSALMIVFAFVASFKRIAWRQVAFGIFVAYIGMSVYVTYMRDRNLIRRVVWQGGSLSSRTNLMVDTVAGMEWFDPRNTDHLDRIEDRMNQSFLAGAAVQYLQERRVPFAYGATIEEAILAVIPRVLWPNKPTVAGSGNVVTTYTGIRFDEETSVGVGQVMESYINFGTLGVLLVFVMIGALVTFVDRSAREYLEAGEISQFLTVFLPGLSLLQVGGSFPEGTATACAAWLLAFALSHMRPLTRKEFRNVPHDDEFDAGEEAEEEEDEDEEPVGARAAHRATGV